MTDLLVRDLDPAVTARLEGRAARNGSSVEEEARRILAAGTAAEEGGVFEGPAGGEGLGTVIARRFAGVGFRPGEIEELRGELARLPWSEP